MDNTTCISQYANNRSDVDILKFRIIVNCPPTFDMVEKKFVNGSLLQNLIASRIEQEVDPILDVLNEIEGELRVISERVNVLEASSNGTRHFF